MSEPADKKRGLPLRIKMRHERHFVEELAGRDERPVGKMVPLSAVEPDPNQPRSALGDLSDLVESIRAKGILEPILVRPLKEDPEEDGPGGSYRIISGERRYRAATEAGLYEVPVIEMAVSPDEALEIGLVENLQRKDLTPFEEAEGYRSLGDRHGYTHEEIAEAVGRSRTVITETLGLLRLPHPVRAAAEALGVSSKSVLREIAKAGDADAMIQLLEQVARGDLGREDLRQVGRQAPRSSRRKKPYTFKFAAPDRTFRLSLSFRKSEVDRSDLISALEQILEELREAEASG